MPARPLVLSLALIAGTIAIGLAVRMAPLGLPAEVVKYGGSVLWAAMVYWIMSTLVPRPVVRAALLAAAIAAAVELFKLHHGPAIDAFRLTLAGKLLLGRVFSGWDLVAYAIAIAAAAQLDRQLRAIRARR